MVKLRISYETEQEKKKIIDKLEGVKSISNSSKSGKYYRVYVELECCNI
ncbi:hypothetical protein SAMN02745248_01506 [Hathewaya proteolytica DSM 3090]|uniref:Uncharacterized protein n=1 Tax=Hathewaya proteolytica DSM 3090 TaxID=1121331 RepID=A0A1M6NUS4_9CLOT|nr:hypothetical protein [Hathewaya proteolytica]SHJ99463.1 hypothetical protein SAMN02745248_01506 [Hathewaya proteolytica DSM 3090]